MLVLKFQDTEDDKSDNKKLIDDYKKYISREYQTLKIVYLKENVFSKAMRKQFISIVDNMKTTSVTNLQFHNCYLPRNFFIELLSKFPNLEELSVVNLMFSDDFSPSQLLANEDNFKTLNFSHLKKFRLKCGDFFCLLLIKSCSKLYSLEILEPSYVRTDVEEMENFLLKQCNLKELALSVFRFNSTYSSNRLFNVPFQLEKLSLEDVNWDIKDHQRLFLTSQMKLKHFSLMNFQHWIKPKEQNFLPFNEMMKHILIKNSHLESVTFNEKCSFSYLKDNEFLLGERNFNVKKLSYIRSESSGQSEMLNVFIRIFPNLKSLTFFACDNDLPATLEPLLFLDKLTALSYSSIPSALSNLPIEIIQNLKKFTFTAMDESKSFSALANKLASNHQMEEIYLNVEPLTTSEIIEICLSFASTLNSITAHNLYFNKTEIDFFLKNFKNLKQISSDIRPSTEVIQILNNANVNFKLIQ